jgi:pulcherriminic acid synthase
VLSRFEIEIAVNRILDALPDLRLVDDTPPADAGLFLRGPATLAVRFSPRPPQRPGSGVPAEADERTGRVGRTA